MAQSGNDFNAIRISLASPEQIKDFVTYHDNGRVKEQGPLHVDVHDEVDLVFGHVLSRHVLLVRLRFCLRNPVPG